MQLQDMYGEIYMYYYNTILDYSLDLLHYTPVCFGASEYNVHLNIVQNFKKHNIITYCKLQCSKTNILYHKIAELYYITVCCT